MTTHNEEVLTQVEQEYDEVYALRRVSDGKYLSSNLDGFRELAVGAKIFMSKLGENRQEVVGGGIYMGNIDTRTRPCWFEWEREKYPFIFVEPMEVVTLQVVKTVSIKVVTLTSALEKLWK